MDPSFAAFFICLRSDCSLCATTTVVGFDVGIGVGMLDIVGCGVGIEVGLGVGLGVGLVVGGSAQFDVVRPHGPLSLSHQDVHQN